MNIIAIVGTNYCIRINISEELNLAIWRIATRSPNINFTNICYMGCKFCGFAKKINQNGAELLSLENIVSRSIEAWDRGATEVCIQGGLHPKISGDIYRNIIKSIKKVLPDMHIHAFSPFEIWYGSSKKKLDFRTFFSLSNKRLYLFLSSFAFFKLK